MSIELVFEGYSDDNFGEYAHTKDTYDNCASGDPIRYLVECDGAKMQVIGTYTNPGVWSVGVAQVDEDVPLPDWPMRFSWERYTSRLHITVPSEPTLICVEREDDE